MFHPLVSRQLGLLLSVGTLAISPACGGQPISSSAKIKHIVIIFQENRTPDNLFHGLPGADINNIGLNSKSRHVQLKLGSLVTHYDLDHSHNAFLNMYNRGRMDGADRIACLSEEQCPANVQFQYVNPLETGPYLQLAEQYTFGDRMFQTNQGPSFPAHQFIIAGTSAPTTTSVLFAAENVTNREQRLSESFYSSGCTAPIGDFVILIDPKGQESYRQSPCFDHPTLFDLLDFKRISWKYYAMTGVLNALWNGPSAIRHIRQGPDWANVVPNQTQVLTDIANRTLPTVSWVMPDGQASDHADITNGTGPSWVASIVNSIGRSKYWEDTAIFVTWDDWGGWYDHVAPPIYNSYEYGFRVPLIVISPYAKTHYVSHVMHDFGSILRFVEENFGLPTLGYADYRADNLSDCFDFNQSPLRYETISAPSDPSYFLNDKSPRTDPDDD
jgi:phospholipase C